MHPDPVSPVFALVGQPNCGKTSLFNALTGSSYHTANYPGSTVEFSQGALERRHGLPAQVVDLPGITSLHARSPDEVVALRSLTGASAHPRPDLLVMVLDATQLARHLYIALQLRDAGYPLLLAITMTDQLPARGRELDVARLESTVGHPVVAVDARHGTGVPELVQRAREVLERGPRPERALPEPPRSLPVIEQLYARASRVEQETMTSTGPAADRGTDPTTRRIDAVLLHPLWGPLAALAVLGGMFASVFWLAAPFMDLVDAGTTWLAEKTVSLAPGSFLVRLLGDGLVRGIGAALVFVPQVAVLFFGMGLMEDSGFLARAAMLADRPLRTVGMNGRSLFPLLSGFACAIPGMLATRAVPDRRERLLTLWAMPLMSCSARLPVFALLLGILLPARQALASGLLMAGLYLASALFGAAAAGLASRVLPRTGTSTFTLELPAFRRPVIRNLLRSSWQRTKLYLVKAGPIIVFLSVLLWLALHLPRPEPLPAGSPDAEAREIEASLVGRAGRHLDPWMRPMGLDWRVGVGLLAAFAAREVFVSTLAIVFHASGDDDDAKARSLLTTLRTAKRADGALLFTPASAAGLVVFFLFAMQCLSTVAVARKESGGWTLPLAQVVVFTGLAYVGAVATVHGLRAAGVN